MRSSPTADRSPSSSSRRRASNRDSLRVRTLRGRRDWDTPYTTMYDRAQGRRESENEPEPEA
jgi:hypothetical protein